MTKWPTKWTILIIFSQHLSSYKHFYFFDIGGPLRQGGLGAGWRRVDYLVRRNLHIFRFCIPISLHFMVDDFPPVCYFTFSFRVKKVFCNFFASSIVSEKQLEFQCNRFSDLKLEGLPITKWSWWWSEGHI